MHHRQLIFFASPVADRSRGFLSSETPVTRPVPAGYTETARQVDRQAFTVATGPSDINRTWRAALGELQLQMPRATFDTWLKGTYAIAYEDGTFVIGVHSAYARDWLENRLAGKIKRTLSNIVGRSVEIKYRVQSRSRHAEEPVELLQGAEPQPDLHVRSNGSGYATGMQLNPRYTFHNFIVGDGNRLAHAAATAVAEHPAERYNPLFIYGGVGLGKTHLLHAVGHIPSSVGLRVRVVSSEQFTNDLISAIRTQTTEVFREAYRQVDVLLIDDIQFIAGKERTQEEFFHTFNTLHGANKQIVITSDRHPKALTTLEERLRSRFEWGLAADIQPPDLETRIAILQAKAETQPVPVHLSVIELIAQKIERNIRELEGALNRVVVYSQCTRRPLTVEVATAALADVLNAQPTPPSVPELLEIVARFYNLTVEELKGPARSRRIVLPRQIAMYLLREEAGLSFPQIGSELGGRDHSTVMHGHEKIAARIARDEAFRREMLQIKEKLYDHSAA